MDPIAAPMPMGEAPVPDPQDGAVVGQPVPGPAPRAPVDRNKTRQDLMFTAILLVAAVVVIGVIFGVLKIWARRQGEDCESPTMTLSSYREMYESGELSQEEYEQIRTKMAAKMKGSMGIKPTNRAVGRNGTPPPPENPS